MSGNKEQAQQKYNRAYLKKRDMDDIPRSMQEYLQFMEYKIRKEIKSFTLLSLCGNDRGNFIVEKSFQRAFGTMTFAEKVDYYENYVENIGKAIKSTQRMDKNVQDQENQQSSKVKPIQLRLKVGKQSKAFQQADVTIEKQIVHTKSKGIPQINLSNYLLRKSKKKSEFCYALQSIRPSEINTIRFAFMSRQDQQKFLPLIKRQLNECHYSNIERQISQIFTKRKTYPNELQVKQIKLKNNNNTQQLGSNVRNVKKQSLHLNIQDNALRNSRMNMSVIQDIVKSRDDQELDQELTQIINDQNQEVQRQRKQMEKKKSLQTPYFQQYKNIFKIMFPNYSLKELSKLHHFGSIYQSKISQLYIYVNVKDHTEQKMQFVVDLPLEIVCKAIYNVQLYKQWHPEINEGQVKLKISSENSCINYLKMKAYSEWYRERDFLFLLHMFRMDNSYFIVGKSIENANFIPFQSITRAKIIHYIWKIQPEVVVGSKGKPKCRVVMEIKTDHEGHLNKGQQKEMTLRFLKGFEFMETYYRNSQNQNKLSELIGFHWMISQRESLRNSIEQDQAGNSLRTCDFEDASEISENEEQNEVFYSIEDLSQQEKEEEQQQQEQKSEHEILPQNLQMNKSMMHSQVFANKTEEQNILTNSQGLIILPKKYLKKKFTMTPFDTVKTLMTFPYDNIVQKDHWVVEKTGGLKLINQVKIASQNNVLKFIMKTLKKNLFSGKGILNISLPVQIFNIDSNLQRICIAMSLGPQFLQSAAKSSDHLQRFKKVLAFGHSNSIIYFDVQKPFNPILGETYQGYIRGCPIYAEQISHHPPITSVYFVGRGYKVTGNLQAKVHVHVNSGDGINEGFYHVIFDDGHEIIFQTPPAEISGLAVGDRRFNFKNQGVYLDLKNLYFCQMKMQASGGFFGKKRQFSDQIQGSIVKIKPQFMKKFMDAKIDKKPSPTQSDIVQKIGELSGRWPYNVKIDDVTYYDTVKNVPDKMIDEIYPLNSNSNYRQDLYYRKKNDLSRSQIQKQRLEVVQRGDRKLRQKFHGPSH